MAAGAARRQPFVDEPGESGSAAACGQRPRPASRITSSGRPGRPVISSTWSTAWCTSRSRPSTSDPPGGRAARGQRGRPRVVDHLEDHRDRSASAQHLVGLRARRGSSRPATSAGRPAPPRRRRTVDRGPPRVPGGRGERLRGPRRRRAPAGSTSGSRGRPAPSSADAAVARRRGPRPGRRARRAARAARPTAPGRRCCAPTRRPSRAPRCSPPRPARPASMTSSSSGSTARLSGIVSDSPRQVASRPARKPAGRPRRPRRAS